jgi:glycosyltransferase involved in cell wall biosynthesis
LKSQKLPRPNQVRKSNNSTRKPKLPAMKRVLIIVYYWPPTGGSGVQRWVKFAKHLRTFGWEPVIYTPENPNVQERDETLARNIPQGIEVLKFPVFEMSKYFGAPGAAQQPAAKVSLLAGLKKRLGNYIRGNYFIPDPRILWVKPSVKFLSKYLESHKIDAIVSSGPPHSVHLIAQKISKQFNIPWASDFRDPWLEILDFHGFDTSESIFKKHEALFTKVIQQSDLVIAAQEGVRQKFQQQTTKPVVLITNGYDIDDLRNAAPVNVDKAKFNLVFVGIFYSMRNAPAFWQALGELVIEDEVFKAKLHLIFVGKAQEEIMADLRKHQLMDYCELTGYVNHDMAIGYEQQADVLLLFTPFAAKYKYDIPGKLFEYLAARRPILCIAEPDNDSAEIIRQLQAGFSVRHQDTKQMKKILLRLFNEFREGKYNANSTGFERYERKNLTEKLANELNRLTGKHRRN